MIIYLCRNSLEGILSGIYDAGTSGKPSCDQKLELIDSYIPELFSTYLEVIPDSKKAESVFSSVEKKISKEACRLLYHGALHCDERRGDHMYRFLIEGFRYEGKVIQMLSLPAVAEMHEMSRAVWGEAHQLTGFVRFTRLKNGNLAGRIGPKHDVLELVSRHFEDRLRGENWLLADIKRNKAAVHLRGENTVIVHGLAAGLENQMREAVREDSYGELWKTFFHTIAIPERENRRCQNTHLPLRYRKYMTEWEN